MLRENTKVAIIYDLDGTPAKGNVYKIFQSTLVTFIKAW